LATFAGVRPGSILLVATAVAASSLAGCGSSSGYANLSRVAAERQALAALESTDPRSALYGQRMEVLSATKSHDPSGRKAWRVEIADRTVQLRFCLYERRSGGVTLTGVSICSSAPVEPPPGMGGSNG